MKRIALTTALALTLAAPAFASDQLAERLDVEPGVYSTAELVAIDRALQDDNQAVANAILSNPGGFNQVDPATINAIALTSAEQDDEHAAANHLRKTEDFGNLSVSSKSGVSAGQAQLAASLGVDAADHTLAELVKLKSVQSSENGRDS